MGRFLGIALPAAPKVSGCGEEIGYGMHCCASMLCTVCAPPPTTKKARKAACELRTEEGDVVLSGSYERCAAEVVKRCRSLFKGTGQVTTGFGRSSIAPGKEASRFAWTIVGPDGAVRSKHAITVLS